MKQTLFKRSLALLLVLVAMMAARQVVAADFQANVQTDIKVFRDFFAARFPEVKFADYANGVYAIDADACQQWKEIEEFPPYSIAVEDGKVLFEKPFANGKTYTAYFQNGGVFRKNYPYYD